ncbi:HNH endonuclease [Klebsiella variicola subsp. variicola]|nr:HNH endonuclease [Klebsiella variicola]MCD9951834.1 HNH endonuclease [Klebsiella variicola subsp. variicola]
MPPRAKRPCRHRGCTAVTNDVGGYCEIHRQQHAGDGWRNYQPGKTRQERGYGRPWEIKRARIMKRDKYLCQNCRRDGNHPGGTLLWRCMKSAPSRAQHLRRG